VAKTSPVRGCLDTAPSSVHPGAGSAGLDLAVPISRGWPLLAALSLALAGCGIVEAVMPPTPAEILAKPAKSGLRDVKVTLATHGTNRLSLGGMGVIAFRPKLASHVIFTGGLGEERIEVDGKTYTRGSLGKWTVSPSTGQVQYGSWADGKDPKLVGEETVHGDKAWHVSATDADGRFDLWVRKSDGYPLKYQSHGLSLLGLEMTFSDFNSGATVAPPPGLQVAANPKTAQVGVGQPARLNFVTVTVIEVDPQWAVTNTFEQPKKGSHFVAVKVQYESIAQQNVSYNQFDWKVVGPTGARFTPSFVPREPQLRSGELQPGKKVYGWIIFEIPDGATGLTLNASIGDDKVLVGL
jgi:Domain of unknown function (DUF4352)